MQQRVTSTSCWPKPSKREKHYISSKRQRKGRSSGTFMTLRIYREERIVRNRTSMKLYDELASKFIYHMWLAVYPIRVTRKLGLILHSIQKWYTLAVCLFVYVLHCLSVPLNGVAFNSTKWIKILLPTLFTRVRVAENIYFYFKIKKIYRSGLYRCVLYTHVNRLRYMVN